MINIDFDALVRNATKIKRKIGNAKLCCVVKCDAYGHGLERTARYLQDIAHCFAVAYVWEANKIAQLGKDILLLLPPTKQDTSIALNCNYVITIDSFDTLSIIEDVTSVSGRTARVHIKIDSGMNRLGFKPCDILEVCQRLRKINCRVEGIFSHFSSADCDSQFTQKQFEVFVQTANFVEQQFGVLTKHIANTSAVFLDPKYTLDMVRCGLGLYGYGGDGLLAVKTLTARVISVKEAIKGEFASYGNTYTFPNDTKIAVIDTGYAFGLSSQLSGKLTVLLNGKKVPALGKICMGMCIVDIGDLKVCQGDQAVILAKENNPTLNTDVSIYELLCNLK